MLKRFAKYYKNHLPLFVLDFSCAFLMSLLDLAFPSIVRIFIDDLLPNKNITLIIWVGAGLLFLYILKYILYYIVTYWGHVLGIRLEYDMRKDLFHHINKLPFSYFDNTKTGHVMSRLVNDLNEISELAHHGPEDTFIASVTIVGSLAILFSINWQLSLVVTLYVLILIYFATVKNKKMREIFMEMRLRIADINAQAEDSISGIRTVKTYTNEAFEEEKFDLGNKSFKETKERSFKVMGSFYAGIDFISNLINLSVLVIGGALIYYNQLKVGEFVGFFLYVSMFMKPIRKIVDLMEIYQRGMAGFRRFMESLDLQPEITDSKEAITLNKVTGKITFDNVNFSYTKNKAVLKDINLTINPKEMIAIVGPSGSGKTTLSNLIPRLYEVDSGSIKIDDLDIRNITQHSLRENMGIIQQDVFLFSGSVRDNISYGKRDATNKEIINAAKAANAHEFIMALEDGYDTYIGERGTKLSGGQKQRLSIARLFLKNPSILILDEATSALDNETEKIIQESFNKLTKDRTTLIIAHRLGTIKHAQRILVLTEDGIVEEGTHDSLMKNQGVYYNLYQAQF
ncbi:ATP-binding cassette, subfamily B [Desulfonispora thiosulfatigenes DSM 11270]|uniref:ATP-binding cassette, subfamily B n=1 Tax=Desulfonispora thiosulfatigenes DSM 11270 TaxID=656914 RepID=A0A1W1VFE8_DESTI|nr:ABC transporter ATP-binding protein [Desulfonispora thiosulfatigenes]SMB92026.1 ATP-binding cassette, subfamily B [Desulfonispora thiosulfatigenes DSM 11270]